MSFCKKIETKSHIISHTIKQRNQKKHCFRMTTAYTKSRYTANRVTMIKQAKLRYQAKREELNTKYSCPCGGRYAKQNKPAHLRSQKHQKYESFVLECIKGEEILYQVK